MTNADESHHESSERPLLHTLPDGTSIHHLNAYETDFMYREVFEERAYFRHGISLHPDACVFDVGANIGLFTLYVLREYSEATVHAFEPCPHVSALLRLNTEPWSTRVTVHECGLSDSDRVLTFTSYPGYSLLSGFCADRTRDYAVLAEGLRNQMQAADPSLGNIPDRMIEMTLGNKLANEKKFGCRVRPLSDVIASTGNGRIDLLKIDAERSEIDIMRGIKDSDWPRIRQVVMEIHDAETLAVVTRTLKDKGFDVSREQDTQFSGTDVTNLYAISLVRPTV